MERIKRYVSIAKLTNKILIFPKKENFNDFSEIFGDFVTKKHASNVKFNKKR